MIIRGSIPSLVIIVGIVTAGCHSTKGGGAPGDAGTPVVPPVVDVTVDNGAQLVRAAMCSFVVRCQAAPVDMPTCQAAMTLQAGGFNSLESLFAAAKAGKTKMDAIKVRQCITNIGSLACENTIASVQVESGCFEAFTGQVAAGSACIAEGECAPGNRCVQNSESVTSSCAGVCTALAKGECADARDCQGGQMCDGNVCTATASPGAVNQACGTGGTCQVGLRCAAGACQVLPNANEACQPGTACAAPNLVCVASDTQTATCVPSKAMGEPCTQPFECGGLLSTLVCDVGGTAKCVERPSSGPCVAGACNPTATFCDRKEAAAQACRPFLAAGTACLDREACGPAYSDADCVDDGTGQTVCVAPTVLASCSP
jgi:hypothetical protein